MNLILWWYNYCITSHRSSHNDPSLGVMMQTNLLASLGITPGKWIPKSWWENLL